MTINLRYCPTTDCTCGNILKKITLTNPLMRISSPYVTRRLPILSSRPVGKAVRWMEHRNWHFSEYRTLVEVLENEFADTVPPEKVHPLAMELLPEFKEIFSGYPLSDDFAHSSEYTRLYTELTGAAAIHIDEYGI